MCWTNLWGTAALWDGLPVTGTEGGGYDDPTPER